MPATPKDVDIVEWFQARWPGHCITCGDPFMPGDQIRKVRSTTADQPTKANYECRGCGTADDDGLFVELSTENKHPHRVMPPGRTKADRCDRCFTIHTAAQGSECQ